MPKSKRNKVVHLTKVKKKGKDHKDDLMKQLEEYISKFKRVFLFEFDHTKSDRIMHLRLRLKEHGRIFAGRNSLVSVAFKSTGSKTRSDYGELLKHVVGHKGLLFSDLQCSKLIQLLDDELPEFRDKLLGYAQLGAGSGEASEPSEGADDETKKTKKPKIAIKSFVKV